MVTVRSFHRHEITADMENYLISFCRLQINCDNRNCSNNKILLPSFVN